MAEDRRLFYITEDWSTITLGPGIWYSIACKGGCRFMTAWVREDEKASENRPRKREAEEVGKVEQAWGVLKPL